MSSHYFERRPTVANDRQRISLPLPEGPLEVTTDAGVFSGARLDSGTRLLLEHAPLPAGQGPVLDLGCGYGPIALSLARRMPDRTVWAVEINERALALTAENAAAAGLGNVVAARPADVPVDVEFAAIYSNPPIRIGKQELHTLLTHWLARLAPGGRAYLVVQRQLGADSLAHWLAEQGWAIERVRSQRGYRLFGLTASATDRMTRTGEDAQLR